MDLSLHSVIIKPYSVSEIHVSSRDRNGFFKNEGHRSIPYYRQATHITLYLNILYVIIYVYTHDEVVPRLPPSRF